MRIDFLRDTKDIEHILDSDDLKSRELVVDGRKMAFYYYDAMSDKLLFQQDIIRPLLCLTEFEPTIEFLEKTLKYGESIVKVKNIQEAAQQISEGNIILICDKAEFFFSFDLKKFNFRSVQEPPTETVIRGPREGFVEEIKTNVSMVRRKLHSPKTRVKQLKVGRYSGTYVSVIYIDGIAEDEIVQKIIDRIKKIDIDGIVDATYVARFIEENSNTIFNQSGLTEKPDIFASKILEGRVGILVDGSPIGITVPYILYESFQDSYDYYTRDGRGSMLRILRMVGAVISVLLPGLFVAMQEYHYHLLPLKFLITILNAVNGIPFTPPMEMLFVLLLFEILNQASVRMPRYVGTAISIVGAIVLGQTAVNAGLISSPAVLVIAISAIGINCVPDLVDAFSILRIMFLLVGSVLGLYGIIITTMLLVSYLCSLESYGTSYMAPFAPIIRSDFKDALFKENLKNMQKRPYSIPNKNHRRMADDK